MRAWIDRRKDWVRLWDSDPRADGRSGVLVSEINGDSVRKILGSYHGCKRGQCISVDISAKRARIGGGE